jgi:two-component system sensor histidine kinase/response regulator
MGDLHPRLGRTRAWLQWGWRGDAKDIALAAVLAKPAIAFRFAGRRPEMNSARELPPQLRKTPAALPGVCILLVEDHEINQMMAREVLESAGMTVWAAGNGLEGVEAVRNGRFDAVLMDVQMPVMSGFEAARLIRQDPRFRDLPIIAMTAAVMPQDREACLAAGMNDHVAKPLLPGELLAALDRWIKWEGRTVSDRGDAAAESPPSWPSAAELPGFDLERAKALLGGNRDKLISLIRQFGEQFGGAVDQLERFARSGNRQEAAALAHTIKGAAGNLGAIELHQSALQFETDLAAGRLLAGAAEFREVLAHVLASGARFARQPVEAGDADGCRKCDWHGAAGLIENLHRLLERDEFVPQELMLRLGELLLCESMRQGMQRIEKAVGDVDYAKAKAVLPELRCVMGYQFPEGST